MKSKPVPDLSPSVSRTASPSSPGRRAFLKKSGAAAVAAMCPLCGVNHAARAASVSELLSSGTGGQVPLMAVSNAGKYFPNSGVPEAVRERLANRLFGNKRLKEEEFVHYLETLGKRVSPKDDFLFVTVANDTLNAFAYPGGVIGMLGGLWDFCESESEFAAIMAHEMGHVKQDHFSRREDQSKRVTAVTVPLIIAGILADNPEVRDALIVGSAGIGAGVIRGYTREMEQEADAVAVGTMRKAGFNPLALANVLGRFPGGSYDYNSTHPAPRRRSAYIKARAKPDDKDATESRDFYYLREKLRVFNSGAKEKRRRAAELKAGRSEDADVLRYSLLLLANKTRDEELGAEASESLTDAARESPVVARAVAESLTARGESDAALELMSEWRVRDANNPAPLDEAMRILSREKRAAESLALYEGAAKRLQKRPGLMRRAADAAAKTGDAIKSNILLTRAAMAEGEFEQALRQIRVAERAAGKDTDALLRIGEIKKSAERELERLPAGR